MTRSKVWSKFLPQLLLFLVMATVIFNNPVQAAATVYSVDVEDNGATVEMEVGAILLIELPGNAGAGFTWNYSSLDEKMFRLKCTDKEFEREGEVGFVGNAYVQSWFLKATKPGTSTIRLLYYPPWEGEETAVNELSIDVIVKP